MKALLVLKGPSATKAEEVRQELQPEILAVVNDAGFLLGPHTMIDYCFFTHFTRVGADEPKRLPLEVSKRITTYVSPKLALPDSRNQWITIEGHKWYTYNDHSCSCEPGAVHERIIAGGIVHHHTASGALHWLCKYRSLRTIHVLGMDGGDRTAYAPGLHGAKTATDGLLDEFKRANQIIIPILQRVYGVEIKAL